MPMEVDEKELKFASFAVPMLGGVYSVASRLRQGLANHGMTVRWIGVGPRGIQAWNEPGMESERAFGEVVAPDEINMAAQARALIEHLEKARYDGVFIDVLGGALQTNIARHLPREFARILLVHNITPGTYAAARAVRDYVHVTVGVSPRIRKDLVGRYGFSEAATTCIPNAVNVSAFSPCTRDKWTGGLRLLFLGRIEDQSKGVFWLPRLMEALKGLQISLTVAGDGPDLAELKRRTGSCRSTVYFTGAVNPKDVPELMSKHDVFLMPSRYEGFGLTLIEAMAAGCVPVASRISGVSDSIIENGKSGFLFPTGDMRKAADIISHLSRDRSLLEHISANARAAVGGRYSLERQSLSYNELIRKTLQSPSCLLPPIPLNKWRVPAGLRPGLRTHLPTCTKNTLRVWRERSGLL